ncbi:MAG: hypothetical protein ABDH21_04660 [bacterium]
MEQNGIDPKIEKLSQEIENSILSIQNLIKQNNPDLLSKQLVTLTDLILEYLLALDYEIKSQNVEDKKFLEFKERVNYNIQRISEYLKTQDEKLLQEVENTLIALYNDLYEEDAEEINERKDEEEKKFMQILNEIHELSTKVYSYYNKKGVTKEEIVQLAKNIASNIEALP